MSDFHARCPRSPCSGHAAAAAQQLLPPLPASPHCLAYLPSLSQPSVVMLYRPGQAAEGPGSPAAECAEGRKRKRDESEDEERTKLRVSEGHGKVRNGESWSKISPVVVLVPCLFEDVTDTIP